MASAPAVAVDAGGEAPPRSARGVLLVPAAAIASFLAAWLVFSVQPMVTRMVLPRLGGGANVWNTSIVFFQLGLLGGYALTHATTTWLRPRSQAIFHLVLVGAAALLLPVSIGPSWVPPVSGTPVFWLLGVLILTVGLPYLALSAISPLVQRWFSLSDHPRAGDPYFLYAVSNAGSLLGLLTYPIIVEPLWSLSEQARAWTVGYALFAIAITCLVLLVRPARAAAPVNEPTIKIDEGLAEPRRDRQRLTWVGYAFIPSSLMVGVTTHITTDVASVPLFWVVPLAIFLVTYILAFGARQLNLRPINFAVLVLGAATAWAMLVRPDIGVALVLHLATFAAVALAFHGRLAERRPPAHRLTEFFLFTSIGGLLGGAFNALLAPIVFPIVIEYALLLAIAVLMIGIEYPRSAPLRPFDVAFVVGVALFLVVGLGDDSVWPAILFVVVVAFVLRPRPSFAGALIGALAIIGPIGYAAGSVQVARSFYGASLVDDRADGSVRVIAHGTTVHGAQLLDPDRAREPITYYSRTGPVGRLFEALDGDDRLDDIAVIGLGAGGLAAYSEPGRRFTFYEIDATVADIATDPTLFTYLSDAPGPVSIVLGDGRLQVERSSESYGVVFADAFSSDAVPVHLLTAEAIETYFDHLDPGGLLVMNMSNRHIDLEPVIAANAERQGLVAMSRVDRASQEERQGLRKTSSRWIVLAREEADLAPLIADGWTPAERAPGVSAWTDDYSNIVRSLNL